MSIIVFEIRFFKQFFLLDIAIPTSQKFPQLKVSAEKYLQNLLAFNAQMYYFHDETGKI